MEDASKPRPRWRDRLSTLLLREPEDRTELLALLNAATERGLLDAEALGMIEGVLDVSDLTVGDVMVPRSQMDVLRIDEGIDRFLPFVIDTGHSRFPVIGEDKDDVLGILLAKDLLRYFHAPKTFDLRATLRPVVFVPESKPLNLLFHDFKATRNHMAVVVDEYGGVSGLVTIEDVLEQIVGEIDDEFDYEESDDSIVPIHGHRFRVRASTEIEDFNAFFGTTLSEHDNDTIAGWVMGYCGHLPKRGERFEEFGLRFTVLRADSRRLHTLLVERIREVSPPVEQEAEG